MQKVADTPDQQHPFGYLGRMFTIVAKAFRKRTTHIDHEKIMCLWMEQTTNAR